MLIMSLDEYQSDLDLAREKHVLVLQDSKGSVSERTSTLLSLLQNVCITGTYNKRGGSLKAAREFEMRSEEYARRKACSEWYFQSVATAYDERGGGQRGVIYPARQKSGAAEPLPLQKCHWPRALAYRVCEANGEPRSMTVFSLPFKRPSITVSHTFSAAKFEQSPSLYFPCIMPNVYTSLEYVIDFPRRRII